VIWFLVVSGCLAVAVALWCFWTATRLDRLHLQAQSARAGLSAALVRRSAAASELALSGGLDPATSLALADAAAAAREPADDWQPQSDLSAVLRVVGADSPGLIDDRLDRACREVSMARRIHNDVAVRAQDLHGRRRVRWFHLAGHADLPRTIEFDALDP
jgi:hypothetical protein